MAYGGGKSRPFEYASKSSHTHVINDADVRKFLNDCNLPKAAVDVQIPDDRCVPFDGPPVNPVRHIIAVDGGYSEVAVQKRFPSATICFFQFGVVKFSVRDLEELDDRPFIDPDDIAKLKRIERLKLVLPVKNVNLKTELSLTQSVRKALFDFYSHNPVDDHLIETLCWFVYQDYGERLDAVVLSRCPHCAERNLELRRSEMDRDFTFDCRKCAGKIYLTDLFRLHEAIDDELGAGGVLSYVMTATEQMLIIHLIRIILRTKPALLKQIMFIKDGPLAFFGQTANMHQPMRTLVRHLFSKHDLFLIGLEKSGAFVEHAAEVAEKLPAGSSLLLDDEYIYKFIMPGKADPATPYGRSTYYSHKVILKTATGQLHVASVPTLEPNWKPSPGDYPNLQTLLLNVSKLKCDMYENALMPIALVNKLVSLADHPSSRILQQFAIESMGL